MNGKPVMAEEAAAAWGGAGTANVSHDISCSLKVGHDIHTGSTLVRTFILDVSIEHAISF